jgi:hypothetical protein
MEENKKPHETTLRKLLYGVVCIALILVSATFVYGAELSGSLIFATGEDVAAVPSFFPDGGLPSSTIRRTHRGILAKTDRNGRFSVAGTIRNHVFRRDPDNPI